LEWYLITAASTGAAFVASFLTSLKVRQKVRWKRPTKVELLLEQKELSRWLITEVAQIAQTEPVAKTRVETVLNHLNVLCISTNLLPFSDLKINECINAAHTALQVSDNIDRRFMFLLARLVDATATAVLRASGEKEKIQMSAKTVLSLKGIADGFRTYTGGTAQIAEWKNQINKKNSDQ
jgi:hypothetical protein